MNWPCFIKFADDNELIYVNDQHEWESEPDLHNYDYDEADYLIDSSGDIYQMITQHNTIMTPQPTGKTMSLDAILGLIKAHAAQKGSCCVAKLYAPTIKDAFIILESLSET